MKREVCRSLSASHAAMAPAMSLSNARAARFTFALRSVFFGYWFARSNVRERRAV